MQTLIEGIHKFRQDELGKYEKLFRRLSIEGQNPHTLFITCSDSRVLAELITQSKPGDLFVVKNVGNIVPPADAGRSTNSTAAAIEFAVQTLGVTDVVICGHSFCGAMTALLADHQDEENMPHLCQWLQWAAPVKTLIQTKYGYLKKEHERTTAAGEENVLLGLENLRQYPLVKSRLETGLLRLHGWFFHIATAEMFAYDHVSQQFQLISQASAR